MSIETHTPPLDLPFGLGSNVRWAKQPGGKLLVFVHGFKGAAVTTWGGYPDQLCLHPEASQYDVVRFGYDSVAQTAGESSTELHSFLEKLLILNTVRIINRSLLEHYPGLRRGTGWQYQSVVLVGHSLGACVIRRALLNQLRGGPGGWPTQTKLIWFAPAHRGAKLFRLLTAVSIGLPISGLDSIAKFFCPVLADLEEDSAFLKELIEDTEELCDKHRELNAPLTFWAWKDKVVINQNFAKDREPKERVDWADHMSICKSNRYDDTVKKLLKEL